MELGLTPSKVDGPGKGGEQKIMLTMYFLPLLLAVVASIVFPPNSTRVGANPPFVDGRDLLGFTHSDIVYNPKSTGIEYTKPGDTAWVRQNTSYARQEVGIELGEGSYRNYQLIYIYALVGRDLPDTLVAEGHPANTTYQYTQHLSATIVGFTEDGLGEVELLKDFEVERRVRCEAFQEWCRKIRVGVVTEINYPRYEARVRFSRPNQRRGAPMAWNSTIPIKGKVLVEVMSPSWIALEFILRYGFNIIAVLAFFWPVTGMGPSLWSRPVEDWTTLRLWCIGVFLSLFWFNEPLYCVKVWAPDSANGLRGLNCWTTTGCVALELGFVMYTFFAAKIEVPQPPSLVLWIGPSQRKASAVFKAERARERERDAKIKAGLISPILSMHRPETPPGGAEWAKQRPSSALLRNPLFFVTTKNVFRNSEAKRRQRETQRSAAKSFHWTQGREGGEGGGTQAKGAAKGAAESAASDEASSPPAWLEAWRERCEGSGPDGSITLKADGPKVFARECVRQALEWVDQGGGPLTQPLSWHVTLGPLCIGCATIALWVLSGSLYSAQLSNGTVPRPRMTTWHALDQHPSLMAPLSVCAGASYAFVWGSMLHAGQEIFFSTPVYMCFYAVAHLTGVLLLFGTLNCSWYPIGTPLLEVAFFRSLVNSFAWVVLFMAQPLADDGTGHFAKRSGMGTAPTTIDEDEDNGEEVVEGGGVGAGDVETGDGETASKKSSYAPVVPKVPQLTVEDVDSDEEKDEEEDEDSEEEEEEEEENSSSEEETEQSSKK